MLDAHEAVVDGVPLFWVESGLPVLTARLRFRAGQADERLPERGNLHLLEHLAFHDLDIPPRVAYNGSVDLTFTSFIFRGPPSDVVRLLGELTSRLGRIDEPALRHEAQIIAQEARTRTWWELENSFIYRWGARGPGLVWFRQFGPSHPDPELLRATARRWFVRENAVLSLDGPIPPGLHLDLPGGSRQPGQVPPPVRRLPAAAPDDRVVFSGLARPGLAAEMLLGVVGSRLNRQLRAAGMPPNWRSDLTPLGSAVHLALIAPSDERQAQHAAAALAVVRGIAEQGPTSAELSEYRIQQEQCLLDEDAEWSLPWRAADERLLGRPAPTVASLQAELEAVDGHALAWAAQSWLTGALLTVPERRQAPGQLPWLFDDDPLPARPPSATTLKPATDDLAGATLWFDGWTLQLRAGQEAVTIDLAELALYGVNPDGQRLLVADSGDRIVVEPGLWRGSRQLISALDAAVPAGLVVPLEPRPPEDVPRATGWAERTRKRFRRDRPATQESRS